MEYSLLHNLLWRSLNLGVHAEICHTQTTIMHFKMSEYKLGVDCACFHWCQKLCQEPSLSNLGVGVHEGGWQVQGGQNWGVGLADFQGRG